MNHAPETHEQQTRDSEMIFRQITQGNFTSMGEAMQAILPLYIMDFSVSRAGISHAIKRLEAHFGTQGGGK